MTAQTMTANNVVDISHAIQGQQPDGMLQMISMLPLNAHNVLDYVDGVTLIASPFLFGFSDVPMARNVMIALGTNAITYSAMTDYKYSIAKIIPLPIHMGLDLLSGATVMAAPYLFGYHHRLNGFQKALHYVLGMGVFVMVATTKSRSGRGNVMAEMVPGTHGSVKPTETQRKNRTEKQTIPDSGLNLVA